MKAGMRALAAEAVGTFCLVFAGCGAIVVNDVSGGAVTHVGVAITFGLVVLAMVEALGDVSGAHLNPAVTVACSLAGRFPWIRALPYVLAQLAGAFAAAGALRAIFPAHPGLGRTAPSGDPMQSLVLEAILTFILVLVVLSVSRDGRTRGLPAGIAVGATVGLEAMFAGPICGASMNPARSLAPGFVSGDTAHLWIYVAGPLAGAAAAVAAAAALGVSRRP